MLQILRHSKSLADKNVRFFYLATAFGDAWFINGLWVFFMRNYISYQMIFLIESVAFTVGLCAEVPSGAIADMLGRKKVALAGYSLASAGVLLSLLGTFHTFWFFVASSSILLGMSFVSGSVEALIYDSLVSENKEAEYGRIVGKSKSFQIWGLCSAVFIGGFTWNIHHYLPWILTSIFLTIAALCVAQLHEAPRATKKVSPFSFLQQTHNGFHSLFQRKHALVMVAIFILGLSYALWSWGLIRLLMGESFGYETETVSYLLSISLFIASLLVYRFDSLRLYLGDHNGLLLLFTLSVLSWMLAIAPGNSLFLGAITFLIFAVAGKLGQGWISLIINKQVNGAERATALSVYSLLQQVFLVCFAIYFYFVFSANTESQSAETFKPAYLFMSILLVSGCIIFVFVNKKSAETTSEFGQEAELYTSRLGSTLT